MKKLIIVGLMAVLVVPSVASAVWWNPLTWGKTEIIQQTATISIPVVSTHDEVELEPATTTPEKPVEKVMTKTITVQDPALQKQINTLIAENVDLKNKLALAEGNFQGCKVLLTRAQADLNDSKTLLNGAQKQIGDNDLVRPIKIELAELNLIKSKANQTISQKGEVENMLNNYTDANGKYIFLDTGFVAQITNKDRYTWRSLVNTSLDIEIKQLEVELAKYE